MTSSFDSIVREQLMEMIERRIGDASILRLIRKWINTGVIDDGRLLVSETGTGQGQIISPLLANVYLHFVLDEWIERDVKPRLRGKVSVVRYADDAVLCFQYREDAEKVLQVLPKRFARYGLTLHPEKTRLVAFGREALARAIRAGTKTDTFDFLGFSVLQRRKERRGRRCRKAAWKMRAGPSGSAFRSGSQTTPSCFGPMAEVVSVGAKARGTTPSRCASERRTKVNPSMTRR